MPSAPSPADRSVASDRADATGAATDRDWALWSRACAGCPRSAQALVERLTPTAYALAWQLLRRREDAEDAVQDAFVRLWRSRPSDDRGARLSTYFNTIVVNRCRSHATARRELATDPEVLQQQADLSGSESGAPAAADPARCAPLAERVAGFAPGALAQRLAAALATLPLRQRMALVMWAWGEAEPPQIAQALDLHPNAAHQLLHRARRALREALEPAEVPALLPAWHGGAREWPSAPGSETERESASGSRHALELELELAPAPPVRPKDSPGAMP